MADNSKKDKLIGEAQKFVLRGQFDKAAKSYEQILALEPGATNLRQKLAELLIKCGRHDEARKELETIGRYFSKNGFYLKAIAVYKQLQKLFPADISLSIILAELNEKHGLVANALSEYKLVYDYHEEAGNIPEALGILDRMQNIDPQNIPIKIKLAEAYAKVEKRDESYSVFTKTATLLLERSDVATFVKICTRVQHIFPDKPDFMFEILAVQIRQGNAATTIECLQNLLRKDPNNKQAWNLITQAYQLLGGTQRLKIAYQHYLNFFPDEPSAMLGLIGSVTADKDFATALELLDKYETILISGGFLNELDHIYHSLDKISPINLRILEGLIRVATAAGDETELQALDSKRQLLSAVSAPKRIDVPLPDENLSMPAVHRSFDIAETAPLPEKEPDYKPFDAVDAAVNTALQPEEDIDIDIEVEIEIDIDSPFASLDQETTVSSGDSNWLNSVEKLFDAIDTAPRVVKFGNEMESSDAQSHFDLGQAFKEMGLYDEAINEFRQASQEASRLVECLIMQCICLRERGEVDKAITMLLALLKPGLSDQDSCSVKYELATGYEAIGKNEEANNLLNEINSLNSGFRDISIRLNATNQSDSLDFSDDDLLEFELK